MISRWLIETIVNKLGYRLVREEDNDIPFDGHDDHRHVIKYLDDLPDYELKMLNDLLPWGSYVIDSNGRRQGKPFSKNKRISPEVIPDPRIIELNERYPLADSTVLEVGCFEGNHTIALCDYAKRVVAIDSRIENVVKTLVRCHLFGHKPDVHCIDLEHDLPRHVDLNCDVLHHIGVLYHLTDPVGHLLSISKLVRNAIVLDTHIATEDMKLSSYKVNGDSYRYYHYDEGGRAGPFSGMLSHAKWLLQDDLINVLKLCGFQSIDVQNVEVQRNGTRILIYGQK